MEKNEEQDFFIGRALEIPKQISKRVKGQVTKKFHIDNGYLKCHGSCKQYPFACATIHLLDTQSKTDFIGSVMKDRPFGFEINPYDNVFGAFGWTGLYSSDQTERNPYHQETYTSFVKDTTFDNDVDYIKKTWIASSGTSYPVYVFNTNKKKDINYKQKVLDIIKSKIRNRMEKLKEEKFSNNENKSLNSSFNEENYKYITGSGFGNVYLKQKDIKKKKKNIKKINEDNEIDFSIFDQKNSNSIIDGSPVYDDIINKEKEINNLEQNKSNKPVEFEEENNIENSMMKKNNETGEVTEEFNEIDFFPSDQESKEHPGKLKCDRIFVYKDFLDKNNLEANTFIYNMQKENFPDKTIRVIDNRTREYDLITLDEFKNKYCTKK